LKERPILFSAPMVLAILGGRKTQTRRAIKGDFSHYNFRGMTSNIRAVFDLVGPVKTGKGDKTKLWMPSFGVNCPYGQKGDRLYVKETWRVFGGREYEYQQSKAAVQYRANETEFEQKEWRPSIFMPRWASRISLAIQSVRVERLQDISEEDARAEGVNFPAQGQLSSYRMAYSQLWDSINGKKHSWKSNPWVWAITFCQSQTRES